MIIRCDYVDMGGFTMIYISMKPLLGVLYLFIISRTMEWRCWKKGEWDLMGFIRVSETALAFYILLHSLWVFGSKI